MKKSTIITIIAGTIGAALYHHALRMCDRFTKGLIKGKQSLETYNRELRYGSPKKDDEEMEITQREISADEVPEEFLKAAMQQQLENVGAEDTFSLDEVMSGTWKERR